MPKSGPIIVVEDDLDDQELMKEIFSELAIPNILRFFQSCKTALDYLLTTIEMPFLIISDINLPVMSGLDFLKSINENFQLRSKSIPFIFLTTTSNQSVIADAYKMFVQGFFVKPTSMQQLKDMMKMIVDYWKISSRPTL